MNQTENIISNYVPVLLEEDALKTIRVGGFVRFHDVKGSEDFALSDRFGEGLFAEVINDWLVVGKESAVVVRLGVGKEVLEILLCFFLENGAISCPNTIRELKSMNSIFLSSNDSLGMEEKIVRITKLYPFISRFLVP